MEVAIQVWPLIHFSKIELQTVIWFCGRWSGLVGRKLRVCLFVFRFYGPVNPMGSCWVWPVYLTTCLLVRLSPLRGQPVLCTFFRLYDVDSPKENGWTIGKQWRPWSDTEDLQSSMGKKWKSANTKKLRAQTVSLFVTEERANLDLVLLNKLRCHAHF